MAANATRIVMTSPFVISYPKLDKASSFKDPKRGNKEQGAPNFSLEMIFDADALKTFHVKEANAEWQKNLDFTEVCKTVAKECWPDKKLMELFPTDDKTKLRKGWAIKDGDQIAANIEAKEKKADHYKGKKVVYAKASQEYPPKLYWVSGGKVTELNRDDKDDMAKIKKYFVGGNICQAELTVKAQETPQGNFVSVYVNHVIFRKDGVKLSQGGSFAERFEGILGGESDIDPTEQEEFSSGGDDI